jgi:Emfourin
VPTNDNDDLLKVERLGGFGGFSLPGSHIKSGGEVVLSQLSGADRNALDALFRGGSHKAAVKPDGFSYRLTRTAGGTPSTIEVAEDQVPMAVRNCVKDTLD